MLANMNKSPADGKLTEKDTKIRRQQSPRLPIQVKYETADIIMQTLQAALYILIVWHKQD